MAILGGPFFPFVNTIIGNVFQEAATLSSEAISYCLTLIILKKFRQWIYFIYIFISLTTRTTIIILSSSQVSNCSTFHNTLNSFYAAHKYSQNKQMFFPKTHLTSWLWWLDWVKKKISEYNWKLTLNNIYRIF